MFGERKLSFRAKGTPSRGTSAVTGGSDSAAPAAAGSRSKPEKRASARKKPEPDRQGGRAAANAPAEAEPAPRPAAAPKFASVQEEVEHGLAGLRELSPGTADPKITPWGEFIDWVRRHPAKTRTTRHDTEDGEE